MVIGIGVDVVDIERMGRALSRTPGLRGRVFGDEDTKGLSSATETASLAARFAAKEAVLKALGGQVPGFSWHDIQISRQSARPPELVITGGTEKKMADLGIDSWHVSLSHDGGVAIAFVIGSRGGAGA